MRTMRRVFLPALTIFLLSAGTADAQMTPIFKMTSSGTCPRYAWQQDPTSARDYNNLFTITCLRGEAPSGADAIRFTAIPRAGLVESIQPDDARWGFGSGGWIDRAPPAQGTAWYARWRFRLNGPQNWVMWDGSGAGYKGFILGNLCQGISSRFIAIDSAQGQALASPKLQVHRNIGPPSTVPLVYYPIDQWAHVQIKIQSSSSATSNDGYIYVYVNNNDEADPTASTRPVGGALLSTSGWTRLGACQDSNLTWGPGAWFPIAPGGRQSMDWADFELDDQFDPNWFLSGPAPTPPTGLIVQ